MLIRQHIEMRSAHQSSMNLDDSHPPGGHKPIQWVSVLLKAGSVGLSQATTHQAVNAFLYVSARSCTGLFFSISKQKFVLLPIQQTTEGI